MPYSAAAQVVVALAMVAAILIEVIQCAGASHAVAGYAHLHAVRCRRVGGSMMPVTFVTMVVSANMKVDAALLAASACLAPLVINNTNKQCPTHICRTG